MTFWILLACSEADKNTDNSVEDETPNTEPIESDFPSVQPIYDSWLEEAQPMPFDPEGVDNTTVVSGIIISMSPMLSLQTNIGMLGGQENVTCPEIDGIFPEEGMPEEDILVTGNGCTDEFGITHTGSFIYNAEGIIYTDYGMDDPSEVENCNLSSLSIFNGGYITNPMNGDMSYMLHLNSDGVNEDCSGAEEVEIFFSGSMSTTAGTNPDASVINGEAVMMTKAEGMTYKVDILTENEEIDSTICESEPISGTNTLSNTIDTYVFTFDGATDCDEEPTQMLSINGGPQEEVAGTSCSNISSKEGFLSVFLPLLMVVLHRKE